MFAPKDAITASSHCPLCLSLRARLTQALVPLGEHEAGRLQRSAACERGPWRGASDAYRSPLPRPQLLRGCSLLFTRSLCTAGRTFPSLLPELPQRARPSASVPRRLLPRPSVAGGPASGPSRPLPPWLSAGRLPRGLQAARVATAVRNQSARPVKAPGLGFPAPREGSGPGVQGVGFMFVD